MSLRPKPPLPRDDAAVASAFLLASDAGSSPSAACAPERFGKKGVALFQNLRKILKLCNFCSRVQSIAILALIYFPHISGEQHIYESRNKGNSRQLRGIVGGASKKHARSNASFVECQN